jgi:hypothetical protein
LRDLPQQKIPRELCDGGDPAIFLYFHVPIESFLMGKIMKKILKNKKKGMEERKRRNFCLRGGSHTHVLSIDWEHRGATALV